MDRTGEVERLKISELSKMRAALLLAIASSALAGCQTAGGPGAKDVAGERLPPWDLGEVQQTYRVDSIADSGPGTLREAISLANKSAGTDRIIFESDDGLYSQPQSIRLENPLPPISDNLLIDGYIDDMLWKASGVIVDGQSKQQILRVESGAKLKLKHLTLTNGAAKKGGAVSNSGELVVEGVTFIGNTASSSGGAIYSDGHRAIVYNSTIYANEARKLGGGAFFGAGNNVLTHATFSDNESQRGGAVFNESVLSIGNSILANSGPGLDCESTGEIDYNVNSIIMQSDGCGYVYSTEDPKLGSPAYYNGPGKTMNLGMRSPATNYGEQSVSLNEYGEPLRWDQRGNGDPRDAAGIVDIGAFETQAQNKVIVDTAEDVDYRWCVVFKNDCSLKGALLIANNDPRFPVITFDTSVFSQPTALKAPEHMQDLKTEITLDASDTAGVSISASMDSTVCRDLALLTLKNVTIRCQ